MLGVGRAEYGRLDAEILLLVEESCDVGRRVYRVDAYGGMVFLPTGHPVTEAHRIVGVVTVVRPRPAVAGRRVREGSDAGVVGNKPT